MSWESILKNEKLTPKEIKPQVMGYNEDRKKFHRRREEKNRRAKEAGKSTQMGLGDFGKEGETKEYPDYSESANFGSSTMFKIFQAASTEETWNEYVEGGLDSRTLQSVIAARNLLSGKPTRLGKTVYTMKNLFADKKDEMLERLNTPQPRKTSQGNTRQGLLDKIPKLIEDSNYADLLAMLQQEESYVVRIRKYIVSRKELNTKILNDSETQYPQLAEIKKILKIGGVPKIEINQTIPPDVVIRYIKKILILGGVSEAKKVQFINFEERNSEDAKQLFGRSRILPSLEFILEYEALDSSNIPTAYTPRNIEEISALKKLIEGTLDNEKIRTIYDKYRESIEAYYGRNDETEEETARRVELRQQSRDSSSGWDNAARKAGKARKQFFNEVREKANEEFQEVMSEVTQSSGMSAEVREDIIEALRSDDEEDFSEAIKALGITKTFDTFSDVEDEIGDIDLVIEALEDMKLMPTSKKYRPTAADIDKLKFFTQEKIDAWSVLDDVMDDNVRTFDSPQNKGGTLGNIIIVLKRLSELYDGEEIDEVDLEEGNISAEEFKDLILQEYPKIRELFLDGVGNNMKELSRMGISMGKKIDNLEPVQWIQKEIGVA